MRAQFPIPTSPTTMIIATMTQDHDAGVGPSRSWIYFNQTYTLLLAGFTLGLPSFHKSLACKESPLGKFITSVLRNLWFMPTAQAFQIPSTYGKRHEALLAFYLGACLVRLFRVTPPVTHSHQSIDSDAIQSKRPNQHRHLVPHFHLPASGDPGPDLLQHPDHLFLKP